MTSRFLGGLAIAALLLTGLVTGATPAGAATATVTNGADSGSGSFRAAVEAANADATIDEIRFQRPVTVELLSEVTYTGPQDLEIDGKGSTLSGASVAPDTDTWDRGLFVATGGGDLGLDRINVVDSFNNGIAVFLPETSDFALRLDRVTVAGAQFHGILVDGQSTTGYNTDDVIQYACTDPYDADTSTEIAVDVDRTTISGAGAIEGFDISLATGCPQDFDGLRVDQGGDGSITGSISRSTFDGNLADGVELDESEAGDVDVTVDRTSFSDNGDTESVLCDAAYLATVPTGDEAECDEGDLATDLDDGFDIDEADDGDLLATVSQLTVNGNRDEGLDFDEAGEGSIVLAVSKVSADGNTDEGLKASEEDGGDIVAVIDKTTITDGTNDAIQLEEEDDGDNVVALEKSTLTDHPDGAGIKVDESGSGGGSLTIDKSDLRRNDEPYESDVPASVSKTRL